MLRLTKEGISLKTLFIMSTHEYKTRVDDKKKRAKLDVKGARITLHRGYEFNPTSHAFEQTSREVKMEFQIRTQPISYVKTDTVKTHIYPVTILFKDISLGFNSPVRIRTGSLRKPIFPKKKIRDAGLLTGVKDSKEREKIIKKQDNIRKENLKITNRNILNGVQLQFYFCLSWVYKQYGLLYGPNWAKTRPVETNPKLIPYLDKHMYYITWKILPKVFAQPAFKNLIGKMDGAKLT
jgi:hypothetical protein